MFLLIGLLRRLVVLALVLAIPLVVCEFIARKLLGDAISSAVKARIGTSPHIGLGSSPVLLQLVRGHIDAATVTASGAHIGELPPISLTATLRDVHIAHLTSLEGGIGSLTIEARLGPHAVRDLLASPTCRSALPADARAGLGARPRVDLFPGRIDLLPAGGRAAEVRLVPAVAGDDLTFTVTALERAGSAQRLPVPAPSCTRALPNLPFGATPRSATVTSGALELAFAASNVTFSAIG
jgi:hypothetical protein